MRGVVFDLSLPKYALARGLGRWVPSLYYGKRSCLRLDDVAPPVRRDRDWATLAPTLAGLCGSDLALIMLHSSPSLEPLSSMPCVLGHEVLARVVESTGDFKEGDRVVVDPLLPCAVRGLSACASCARGDYNICLNVTTGHLAPGMFLGFHRELPGGWGDRMVAHGSQLHKVPDSVPDELAALTEPLAVGMHAVLKAPPRAEDKVLVIGGGMIAYSVLAAMRLLELPAAARVHLSLLEYQAQIGRSLGATFSITDSEPTRLAAQVCHLTGATAHQPLIGPPIVLGGFDIVYDCVGSKQSLDTALRFARGGGTVVLLGASGVIKDLDWSFVWSKELTVLGTLGYSVERGRPGGQTTFQVVLDRLTDASLAAPLAGLVTHRFPLERYQDAIVANVDRATHRSVKTLFTL
jgi:L-iditol 2-dehydrogenase